MSANGDFTLGQLEYRLQGLEKTTRILSDEVYRQREWMTTVRLVYRWIGAVLAIVSWTVATWLVAR